jgi:hypothetical protein
MLRHKLASLGLSLLTLTSLIIGTAWWGRAFFSSLENYRSALGHVELPAQAAPAPAQATKLVVVVVSGLGYDASLALDLPILEQLKQSGTAMAVESIPPTYSQTAWATLITGAPAETNDAPPVDLSLENLRPLQIDTIFNRASSAQLPTALLAQAPWRRLLAPGQLSHTFFVDQPGPEADASIVEAALPFIADTKTKLIVVQFSQVDWAGQYQGGTNGGAYRQAALQVDAYLGQIIQALDLGRGNLVVVGDHGHIGDGGHGGNEVEVIWQPLVAVGRDIVPGSYSDVRQVDIAPTLTTLLGVAPPTASQGRILFEMLRLSEKDQTVAQLTLAQQRLPLAAAYFSQLAGTPITVPESIGADLERAKAELAANNITGALELAQLTQQEADRLMATARNSQVFRAQWPRLVVALLLMLIWLGEMWRRRGKHAGAVVLGALFTIGLYHVLYQLQGHTYSVSGPQSFADWPLDIAQRTAVVLLAGGGLMLIFMMMTREDSWLVLLGTGYGYGLLVAFLFALPLFWAFWQNGLIVTWHLPAIVPLFWQITGLLEVLIAAILGLLLPWPIMGLSLFVTWMRRRLDESRARAKSDALPGLHL